MRIAYLDCFSGISGDMFLGALVDAGVSPKLLEDLVEALDIGARLEISRVTRAGIAATKVNVYAHGEKDLPREVFWEQRDHPHHHADEHVHDESVWRRGPAPPRTGQSCVTAQHGRGLSEIRRIIEKAAISTTAKTTAIKIFEALGEAEAEIHHTSIDQVHFHEVGAVDAMVDIVCAAVGAESLAVEEWVCSPLNVGGGTVECAHGTLPVPAPATLKLLRDAPVYSSGPQVELVTPTGAAIVKTLSARFAPFPAMKIEKAGYGAGTRDFPEHPNLLRLTIGEAGPADSASTSPNMSNSNEKITVLEANLDDLSPQVLAYAMERLLAEGALDVFSVPVQMKKSRPGALLTVLAKLEDANRLTRMIFAETTTLGVRRREEQRQTLSRRWETVDTTWGRVRIKIASMNGSISNYAPEYEDCRALAEAHHIPLKEVIQEAVQAYANGNRSYDSILKIRDRKLGGLMRVLNLLRDLVQRVPGRLEKLSQAAVESKPTPSAWSPKEELGHLLDSAANNHQRIVRAQFEDELAMPGYEQNRWVAVHAYQRRDWVELIELWQAVNRQLLAAAEAVPDTAWSHTLTVASSEPLTLQFVFDDYVTHMVHHLKHIGIEVDDIASNATNAA